MADEPMVEVRFSEVHWYTVKVPKAELDAAAGGPWTPGQAGPASDWPDEVAADVSALLGSAASDQKGALQETDGLEVHSVKPVS